MSKTFTYEFVKKVVYLENSDETEEIIDSFDYEVFDEELLYAVADFVYDNYFSKTELADGCAYGSFVRKNIRRFIEDFDLLEMLVENYEDELKDYFEDEAMEYYKNDISRG